MREIGRRLLPGLAIASLAAALQFATLSFGTSSHPARAAAEETVTCRVLEVHTLKGPGFTVAVFHQRDEKDRERLGSLLRQHPEAAAEIQTTDGTWHTVTVLRLKSCFGRGLLLLPSGTAQLPEKSEFLLKFPPD